MKIFELYEQSPNSLIVGGHHGDEPIGVDICKKLIELIPENNGVHIIPIANRPAFIGKTREFDGVDLNRSYGNNVSGVTELDEMSDTIKGLSTGAKVVIDCHSTPIKDLDEISVYPNLLGAELAPLMGLPYYMQEPPETSLRGYCEAIGVPMITFEGVHELHEESVAAGVAGIMKLLNGLNLL